MGLRSPRPSSHTPPRSSDLPSISQGRAPCENTEHKPKSSSSYFTEKGVKSNLKPRFAKGDPPHSHCALCSRSPPVYGTISISHKLSLFLLQTNTEYLLSIISLFSQQTASRGPQGLSHWSREGARYPIPCALRYCTVYTSPPEVLQRWPFSFKDTFLHLVKNPLLQSRNSRSYDCSEWPTFLLISGCIELLSIITKLRHSYYENAGVRFIHHCKSPSFDKHLVQPGEPS